MTWRRAIVFGSALLWIAVSTPVPSHAGFTSLRRFTRFPTLDSLEIIVRSDEVIAIDGRLGGTMVRERLDVDEQPIWVDARGEVGVVVTNKRVLAMTIDSPRWMWTRIGVHESLPYAVALGDRVALALTDHRAIGVASGGRMKFFTEDIGPNERVIDSLVAENVALIVTDKRLLGLSAFQSGFYEQRVGLHEEIQDVAALADFATVATHRRVLVFQAVTATWQEQRVSLH